MKVDKLALHIFDGILMVKIEKVVHLEANGNYTNVYLDDNSKILVTKTLKELDELLKTKNFCRVHKSHLINLDKIEKYKSDNGYYVIMENGAQIEVARRKKNLLLNVLTA
jgi:two-component system, LytTR family, response regulator